MTFQVDELIDAFIQVAQLARVSLDHADVCPEVLPPPHKRPRNLPPGSQAVYAFLLADRCLKVGKVGPITQARFTSQHYGMNTPSTLAKSILANRQRFAGLLPPEWRKEVEGLDESSVGAWIQHDTTRLDLFLPTATGALALSLQEAFVQCRLNPLFEGTGGRLPCR
jgi:hypothetical protein